MSVRDSSKCTRVPGTTPPQLRELRDALGMFATGVTIVTARPDSTGPVGMTVNSFTSLSLDPPLVLWGISKLARSFEYFATAAHWAVHVLAVEQEPLARRFAAPGADKFAGLPLGKGLGGVPLLDGCCARFECRAAAVHDAGDHLILVGAVKRFSRADGAALVFRSGKFAITIDSTRGGWQFGGASAGQDNM
jgi:3-hydroxy-9,10-secoandrosta-1,3,5(10)-triene-9,17-dione monooxygenase reductase component